ncbi:MAG TPA: DUF1223 domain-containing protein [Candidatus Acidoferrales bacterium]|jgi:hypothetical protein|nr:DUF1223 domain-containing protein [Candidatus Acidoferrales bacterium]
MDLRSVRVIVFLVLLVVLGFVVLEHSGFGDSVRASLNNDSAAVAVTPDAAATPVLVELFTSEGCSSCPPADALLSRLGRTQPVHGADIIALEEHVDYWDRLGWKDPFSSEAATERQNDYGSAFGGEQIYTPQMIVDGRTEFVGSSDSDALRAIRSAIQSLKPAVQLDWGAGDNLKINVSPLASAAHGDDLQLFLVVAENMLHTDVKRGENAGRALEHNGVVRQLSLISKINSPASGVSSNAAVHPAREWNRENLRAVVFVQERHSRHILAVAAIPFPKM